MAEKKWNDIQERGNLIFFEIMFFFYRVGGRALFNFILFFVIFWYWIFSPLARQSSYEYLTNVHNYFKENSPFRKKPNIFSTYKHLYYFGYTLLEKMFGWFGVVTEENIKLFGWDCFHENYQKGAVIIVSHFGNVEIIRSLRGHRQKINVLVYTKHSESYNRMLNKYAKKNKVELIPIEKIDIAEALLLQEKIAQGEWVLIAADRVPVHSKRVISCDFLGKAADWPIGPWLLANLLECPVISLFCYFNQDQYEIHIGEMYRKIEYTRENRDKIIKEAIEEYALILEKHCQEKPYLWFNFFKFWNDYA
ncbi:acyltransferase [Neisseriaceae bacterium PsAf]|nr:acyltransferase [Neisseriaceae bacterium PsAf]